MDKPVFVTYNGLNCYTHMPFGLRNAPETFQRATAIILVPFKWQHAPKYLDDVVIFSKNSRGAFTTRWIRPADYAKGWYDVEAKGVVLHFRRHQLPKTHDHDGVTTYCYEDEGRRTKHILPDHNVWSRFLLRLVNVNRWFVPNFVRGFSLLNKQMGKG